MANTTIQIRRSSNTATPIGGTLAAAELAYSYNSSKLFIGSANGLDVIAIGGKFFTDLTTYGATVANAAYSQANAAYDAANNAGSLAVINTIFQTANSAWSTGNAAYTEANAAFSQANSAWDTANGALQRTGGTVSGQLNITGNLVVSGTTTYANIQHLLVSNNYITLNSELPSSSGPLALNSGFVINRGTSANTYLVWDEGFTAWGFTNDGTNYYKIASNTDVSNVASGANGFATTVGTAANSNAATAFINALNYANSNAFWTQANANSQYAAVGAGANAYATTVGSSANAATGAGANAYAAIVGSASNTYSQNASHINSGTLAVNYGGTGAGTFTANGVLIGNGTGAFQVTNTGTDGQVLQVVSSGIPSFGMLDGGNF